MKRSVCRITGFLFLLILLQACSQGDRKRAADAVHNDSPNVIIILSDDQGWGDLSIKGNTNLQTPHIDRLAGNGASFDRFYVCPVCSPTRAELLTGRYHTRGGVYSTSAGGERLDLDEKTLAEYFREAGYATAAFGKWHNGMQYPYHPNARGFDEYYGFCSGHWGDYFSPPLEHNGALVQGEGFMTDDFTNKAMAFIEAHADSPFLVYLPYNTPHSPMQVPDAYWDRFENKELAMRNREAEKENLNHTRAALAMCENIDDNVGRLMAKLEELGLTEETIVLYFSDNGPNGVRWNGDMRGRKGSTDEGGVRSPLIMQWEGHIPDGKEIPEIAGAIDLLPTLADLCGIDFSPAKPLDGISLKALLLEEENEWDERYIFNHWGGRTSVRSQQYRLDHEDRLYDMANDPGQRSDISAEQADIHSEMLQEKEAWRKSVFGELPAEDNRTFPVGHPDFEWTQIPARDGTATGLIERSNRYPNCSFFSNWIRTEDEIFWASDVVESGDFEVTLHYTCKPENLGTVLELSFGAHRLETRITESHDPPLRGMENDRDPRIESYVKDFRTLEMGNIHLDKGLDTLRLRALSIPGEAAIDFRLLMLRRIH